MCNLKPPTVTWKSDRNKHRLSDPIPNPTESDLLFIKIPK